MMIALKILQKKYNRQKKIIYKKND